MEIEGETPKHYHQKHLEECARADALRVSKYLEEMGWM